GFVEARERGKGLRVIAPMVHKPVLRLLVGIGEPVRRHLGGNRRHGRQDAARQQGVANKMFALCHKVHSPCPFRSRASPCALFNKLARSVASVEFSGHARKERSGRSRSFLPVQSTYSPNTN